MSDSPKYSIHRKPQFSANHMAEYLACQNATQRTKAIRAAKYPKKVEVAAYSQIRRPLRDALTKPDFNREGLDFLVDRIEEKARREAGYSRDEALRCSRAIRAFQSTFNPRSFTKYELSNHSRNLSTRIEGVKINVTLDASLTATSNDITNSGGIILLYSFSADRGSMKDRMATTSGLMLWTLEGGQMEPLPRLCMTADIAERDIVRASQSHSRFRDRVRESCKEIAARWHDVEPPHDYDGPDWK